MVFSIPNILISHGFIPNLVGGAYPCHVFILILMPTLCWWSWYLHWLTIVKLKSASVGCVDMQLMDMKNQECLSAWRSVHFTSTVPSFSPSAGVLLLRSWGPWTAECSWGPRLLWCVYSVLRSALAQGSCDCDERLDKCAVSFPVWETICHVLFPAAHRGCGLHRPAVSVQEEEREAHRRGDAAGGPARYGQAEASQLGSGVTVGTVFGNQSSFCCLTTKMATRPPVSSRGGGADKSIQIKSSLLQRV